MTSTIEALLGVFASLSAILTALMTLFFKNYITVKKLTYEHQKTMKEMDLKITELQTRNENLLKDNKLKDERISELEKKVSELQKQLNIKEGTNG